MLRLISTPDLAHKFQLVRDDGLPDVQLTLFADDLLKSLSPSSVPIYMRELVAILGWAPCDPVVVRNGWNLYGPPPVVRNIIREYLTVAAKCKVTSRADRLGLKIAYVCQTSETSIIIRILLAVLRRFYDHLTAVKVYEHANPLLQEDMAKVTDQLRANYRRTIREAEGGIPCRRPAA